jgi:hypothetical protein
VNRRLTHHLANLGLTVAGFVATAIAGEFGALLNKYAPIRGGSVIILARSRIRNMARNPGDARQDLAAFALLGVGLVRALPPIRGFFVG